MPFFRSKGSGRPADPSAAGVDRRSLVVGTGVAGAAAVGAAVLHRQVDAPAVAEGDVAADAADGYRETPHVLRYYQTTRA